MSGNLPKQAYRALPVDIMNLLSFILILSTFCCAMVTGIALIFAIVIMPGLKTLGTRGFLSGFKAIDRVIQESQPVFMFIWLGSALFLLVSTGMGFAALPRLDFVLMTVALVIYLLGVQLPTARINVPLNNQLQTLDLENLSEGELERVREAFAPRWLRWNVIRTWFAAFATLVQLVVLLRM